MITLLLIAAILYGIAITWLYVIAKLDCQKMAEEYSYRVAELLRINDLVRRNASEAIKTMRKSGQDYKPIPQIKDRGKDEKDK